MVYATALSALLILLPLSVPFLHPIFDVDLPDLRTGPSSWHGPDPSVVAEITKIFLRKYSAGFKQKMAE